MGEIIAPHAEQHRSHRSNWLRAAVLGVNDGVVSTAALMLGVAAADVSRATLLTTGVAGLTAGALSMAVGEYVSVSSQRDSEHADIHIERTSLADNPDEELAELAHIYEHRGLEPKLALQVAEQLHEHDAEAAHLRDELGIATDKLANPLQAAVASAVSFAVGAFVPILAAVAISAPNSAWAIVIASLVALAISGAIGAYIGGGHRLRAAARVFFGGGAAMAITYAIGHIIGSTV